MNLLEDIFVMPNKKVASERSNNETDPAGADDLVALAQEGNMNAIGTLYDQHHENVFRYVWSRVSDRQLAEDLTGEVFIRMLAALPHHLHLLS